VQVQRTLRTGDERQREERARDQAFPKSAERLLGWLRSSRAAVSEQPADGFERYGQGRTRSSD
jgi:hypothetical protein